MKFIKRLFLFIAIFLLYFILKEFIEFLVLLKSIHVLLPYIILTIFIFLVFYLVVTPIYQIFKLPPFYGPTYDKNKETDLIKFRIDNFKENKYLNDIMFDFSKINYSLKDYQLIITELEKKTENIRKKYVFRLLINTAISQNGFLDAFLIFSANVNLIKEIFILYRGRTSTRDLFTIAKNVYYSIAIGGSKIVEYATEELLTKAGTDILEGVPFISKLASSVADGLVNAILITRVSIITENFCKLTYISNKRQLYPREKVLKTMGNDAFSLANTLIKSLKKKKDVKQEDIINVYNAYFELLCSKCEYYDSKNNICRKIEMDVKSFPQEFYEKCNSDLFEEKSMKLNEVE